MLTNNPLLQLSLPRVKMVLARMNHKVWEKVSDLECHAVPSSFDEHQSVQSISSRPLTPVRPGHALDGAFRFYWYCVTLPKDRESHGLFFHWDHAAESTAYIDRAPLAGFDEYHKYVRLPAQVKTIWLESTTTSEKQALKTAALYKRNDLAWKLKNDLEVLINLMEYQLRGYNPPFGGNYSLTSLYRPPLDFVPRFIRRLLRLLEIAADAFEKEGIEALNRKIEVIYDELKGDPQTLKLAVSAQAHLDPVFLWPENVGFAKILHTFSSSVYFMNEYPEMKMQFSQPYAYELVQKHEPAFFQKVKSKIESGQWEMEGGLYSESDTQIPCGEALARCFEIGQQITRDIQGESSTVAWLPDSFGFSACLPQMIVQFGMHFFYTTKINWNSVTHFPYSSFRWHGNDGSEVIAHLSQHQMGYRLNSLPDKMINVEKIYRQGDVHDESLAPVGHGDGGGGITAEQIEYIRRIKSLYGVPRSNFRKVKDFFNDLKTVRESLPQYDGELYLETHRGIYTTRGALKAAYRALERALQKLESVHAIQGLGPIDDNYWKRLTFAQFHDILPGSLLSMAAPIHIQELTTLAQKAESEAIELLNQENDRSSLSVFNPLPLKRNVWVKSGSSQKMQCFSIAPHSGNKLIHLQECPDTGVVRASQLSLQNDHVKIAFNELGEIVSFQDRGKDIRFHGPGAVLTWFKEMPSSSEPWEIDIQSLSHGTSTETKAECTITQNDSHCGQLKFYKKIGDQSSVAVYYTLYADESYLRITYKLDWQDPETLLKAVFPTDYKGRHVRYGTPFGSCLRPQYAGMPHDVAQWEVTGNRWAAVFDEGEREGLGIVTKDKYGFNARNGTIGVSLVRSPISSECAIANQAGSPNAVLTDIGTHVIEMAVGYYSTNLPLLQHPAALADIIYTESVAYSGPPLLSPFKGTEGDQSLLPCWIRPVDKNSWILRLHEITGQHGSVRVLLEPGWNWKKIDLSHRELQNGDVALQYKPYEIVSLMIRKC